jgi:hypothetical protein
MIDRATFTFLTMTMVTGLAMTGGVACRKDTPDTKEPRAIARAFEAFEGAAPSDKRAALDALAHAPCSADPLDCTDRDACVHYASALQNANELSAKAKALGPEDAGGSGAATEQEYVVIVTAADDAVKTAEAARPQCLEALDRLHRRAAMQ